MANHGIAELCEIEADDMHHEVGGAHGAKGHDFARYWVIWQMILLAESKTPNYLFLLEFMQDVARLDHAESPTSIILYQLKKKDGGPWTLNLISGIAPKKEVTAGSILAKLVKSFLAVTKLDVSAEFVSNSDFKVVLENGDSGVGHEYIAISELSENDRFRLVKGLASVHSVDEAKIKIDALGLRHCPLGVNAIRTHVIGEATVFFGKISPKHAGQAESFVDALYAQIATASRSTVKCKTWEELVTRRGYQKQRFDAAISSLSGKADMVAAREQLVTVISEGLQWRSQDRYRVNAALTEISVQKILQGTVLIPAHLEIELATLAQKANETKSSDVDQFNAFVTAITAALPGSPEEYVRALAIYTMVELWQLPM